MEDAVFEKLVAEAIADIPPEFKEVLSNVDITIEEVPTLQQRKKLRLHNGMFLLGLYEGIPRTERSASYTFVLPDKITIFKNPIVYYFQTPERIKEHVRLTVLHEIGHHFGLSDAAMRKIGK